MGCNNAKLDLSTYIHMCYLWHPFEFNEQWPVGMDFETAVMHFEIHIANFDPQLSQLLQIFSPFWCCNAIYLQVCFKLDKILTLWCWNKTFHKIYCIALWFSPLERWVIRSNWWAIVICHAGRTHLFEFIFAVLYCCKFRKTQSIVGCLAIALLNNHGERTVYWLEIWGEWCCRRDFSQ